MTDKPPQLHQCPNAANFSAADAAKFAPIVYLHSHETDFPSSVDWYLDRVVLRYKDTIILKGKFSTYDELVNQLTKETLVSAMSPDKSSSAAAKNPDDLANDDWQLQIVADGDAAHDIKHGPQPTNGAIIEAPVYWHAFDWTYDGTDYIAIQYFFFYPYNGSLYLPADPLHLKAVGSHQGDWEHVIVLATPDKQEIEYVFFSAHSGGAWVRQAQLELEGGRPVVYAANQSHASYSQAGEHTRGVLPTDHCNKGHKWATFNNLSQLHGDPLQDRENCWNRFVGRWGLIHDQLPPPLEFLNVSGPSTPAFKNLWCDPSKAGEGVEFPPTK